jgi:hypothetical protein
MCIHYLHHIHPPTAFPATSFLPPVPPPNLFYPPVLRFCEKNP